MTLQVPKVVCTCSKHSRIEIIFSSLMVDVEGLCGVCALTSQSGTNPYLIDQYRLILGPLLWALLTGYRVPTYLDLVLCNTNPHSNVSLTDVTMRDLLFGVHKIEGCSSSDTSVDGRQPQCWFPIQKPNLPSTIPSSASIPTALTYVTSF